MRYHLATIINIVLLIERVLTRETGPATGKGRSGPGLRKHETSMSECEYCSSARLNPISSDLRRL